MKKLSDVDVETQGRWPGRRARAVKGGTGQGLLLYGTVLCGGTAAGAVGQRVWHEGEGDPVIRSIGLSLTAARARGQEIGLEHGSFGAVAPGVRRGIQVT